MKKTALICLIAMVALVGFSASADAQVYFTNVGRVGPGSLSLDIPFDEGGEWYGFAIILPFDVTTGSGHGMMVDTLGSDADTELACYGALGYGLISGNDDGETGSWGDPGLDSVLLFGDTEMGNGDRYQGFTNQGNETPWNTELPSGGYVFAVGTYNSQWDEADARLTPDRSGDFGYAVINGTIF